MRKYNQHGFTFIELMTTVVIIGIVAAMAVPRFQKAYERMKFSSINKDVVSTLKVARSMSISNKDIFGVNFDANAKTVSLFKKDPASILYNTFEATDSVIRIDTLSSILSTLTTDLTNSTIAFRPNGSAIFGGGGNIVSMAITGDLVGINQINVLASTGRVQSTGHYY